jgi:hypothetical protein
MEGEKMSRIKGRKWRRRRRRRGEMNKKQSYCFSLST